MQDPTKPGNDSRRMAYRTGAKMARDRIQRESPLDAEALRRVEASDVLVIPGSYDHVEQVLQALDLPFQPLEEPQLRRISLRPEQLLIINCPGNLDPASISAVRRFVQGGGSLFTTDWALRNVVEPAFPGFVEYNERPTADDVVRIEMRSRENPFLKGVMEDADDPQWWLEGSSYPIRVLDQDNVEVLITSRELKQKYGEAAVAVQFMFGKGEVFHMISHYYLQRTELRSERHGMNASAYAAEKGYAPDAEDASAMANLSVGDVESAHTSARLFANIVADKKRRSTSPKGRKETD